jgi:hypothetical protein
MFNYNFVSGEVLGHHLRSGGDDRSCKSRRNQDYLGLIERKIKNNVIIFLTIIKINLLIIFEEK